jgi:hypothetical protein
MSKKKNNCQALDKTKEIAETSPFDVTWKSLVVVMIADFLNFFLPKICEEYRS